MLPPRPSAIESSTSPSWSMRYAQKPGTREDHDHAALDIEQRAFFGPAPEGEMHAQETAAIVFGDVEVAGEVDLRDDLAEHADLAGYEWQALSNGVAQGGKLGAVSVP